MYFWLWLNILMWEVHQFFRSYDEENQSSCINVLSFIYPPTLKSKTVQQGKLGWDGVWRRNWRFPKWIHLWVGSTCTLEMDHMHPSESDPHTTYTPVSRIHIQPAPQWVGEPEHLHPHIYPATLHISCHILSTHVGVVTLLLSLLYWVSQHLSRGLNRITPEV